MREVLESYTKSDSFHSVSSPLNPALKLAGLWWDSYYYAMISTIGSRNHISMSSAAIIHIYFDVSVLSKLSCMLSSVVQVCGLGPVFYAFYVDSHVIVSYFDYIF